MADALRRIFDAYRNQMVAAQLLVDSGNPIVR